MAAMMIRMAMEIPQGKLKFFVGICVFACPAVGSFWGSSGSIS